MTKPIFIDQETVIAADFLNTVASTVYDALDSAASAAAVLSAINGMSAAPNDANIYVVENGLWTIFDSANVSPPWGNITGILSNQTDLQAALDAKLAAVSDDVSPVLGGNLNLNGKNIYNGGVTISSTEFGYLDGITANVQTQLNGKLSAVFGDTSPTLGGNLNLSTYGFTASGHSISATEVSHLDGVTSSIQSQINGKISALSEDTSPSLGGTLRLNSKYIYTGLVTISPTEFGYLDGVTSGIQSQLNGKLSTGGGTISGNLAVNGSTEVLFKSTDVEGAGLKLQKNGDSGYTIIDQQWNVNPKNLRIVVNNGATEAGYYFSDSGVLYTPKITLGGGTVDSGGAHCGRMYGYGASGDQWGINCQAGSGYGPVHFRFVNAAGTQVGYISSNSTTTTYATSSDRRLKKGIKALTKNGLDTIKQVLPREFKWKENDTDGIGFIADELEAVVPEAVCGKADDIDQQGNPAMQGIDYSKLVPYLVQAINELSDKVNSLEVQLGKVNKGGTNAALT